MFMLCTGRIMEIDAIVKKPSSNRQPLADCVSAVVTMDDLPDEYLRVFLDSVTVFVKDARERPLEHFIARLNNPLLKKFLPYTETAPPGVSRASMYAKLPDSTHIHVGLLRLPEDESALAVLTAAVSMAGETGDDDLSTRLKKAMSSYYQSSSSSIDVVRRAIASAKVDIKEIPHGSVWQPKKLRGLAVN